MNPALLRFLAILKQRLIKRLNEIATQFGTHSVGSDLENLAKLLENFIKDENINNESATKFIADFRGLKKHFLPSSLKQKNDVDDAILEADRKVALFPAPKKNDSVLLEFSRKSTFFTLLEDGEIYTLALLLHKNKDHQTLNLSAFEEHFRNFLRCPLHVKQDHDRLKFVLSLNDTSTEAGAKQEEDVYYFYDALTCLGINPSLTVDKVIFTITIPSNHIKDMLQLAQFELIDEEHAPEEIAALEQKFRYLLTELIQTEASLSAQCGELAGLLTTKLRGEDQFDPYKLTLGERKLLTEAQEHYREIANNPYPWFGEKLTAEQLKSMSLEEMLQLCHSLYEGLRTNDNNKAEEIGRRVGIMKWASIHNAELNHLINGENRLKFPDSGEIGSDKQIALTTLATPVQRLPRLILLTGELVKCAKCINTIAPNRLDESKAAYLGELQALNEEWIREAEGTNERIKKAGKNGSTSIAGRIFAIFNTLGTAQPPSLSTSMLTKSTVNHFSQLRHFMKQPISNDDTKNPSEEGGLVEDNELIIPENFHDDLTRSVIFTEGTVKILYNTDNTHVSDDSSSDEEKTNEQKEQKENFRVSVGSKIAGLGERWKNFWAGVGARITDFSPTLSRIGGGTAVFGGMILIAAGTALILLQPTLLPVGIVLIVEGCATVGMGAALLKAEPVSTDMDKDFNSPYFLGVQVGKSTPVQKNFGFTPSPLGNQTQNTPDRGNDQNGTIKANYLKSKQT